MPFSPPPEFVKACFEAYYRHVKLEDPPPFERLPPAERAEWEAKAAAYCAA